MPPHDDDAQRIEAVEPLKPVFALDASLTMNLGGNRQLTLNTRMLRDDSEEENQAKLDKLLRQGDRAKARYDLEELEDQFHTVAKTIKTGIASLPGIEFTLKAAREARQVQVREIEAKIGQVNDAGYAEHAKAGKAGPYNLSGARKNEVAGLIRDIGKVKAEDEAAVAQSLTEREMVLGKIAHYQEDLGKRRVKINALRELAGQPPMTDYADIEAAAIAEL